MTLFFAILFIIFYIIGAVLLALVAGFCGIKIYKPKNILLIIFYPIGVWFLK